MNHEALNIRGVFRESWRREVRPFNTLVKDPRRILEHTSSPLHELLEDFYYYHLKP